MCFHLRRFYVSEYLSGGESGLAALAEGGKEAVADATLADDDLWPSVFADDEQQEEEVAALESSKDKDSASGKVTSSNGIDEGVESSLKVSQEGLSGDSVVI